MNTRFDEIESAFSTFAIVRGKTDAQDGPLAKDTSIRVQSAWEQLKEQHIDITVTPATVLRAAELADKFGFAIDTITGVDWIAIGQMEVIYDFFHPLHGLRLVVHVRVPRDSPALPSIHEVFPGANWHERETHDFFGINFIEHPDLRPLLLPEEADYHPLRKDFRNAG